MPILTLTPDPSATPPSILVEVGAQTDAVISSAEITRDGMSVLGSAQVGFNPASYTDYSAPYGRAVSYRVVGVESVQTWPALWSEAWPDLTHWSGSGWSVSGGIASSGKNGASITRAVGAFGKLTVSDVSYSKLELRSSAGALLGSIACSRYAITVAGTSSQVISLSNPMVDYSAWIDGGMLHVEAGSQSASVPITGSVYSVSLVSQASFILYGLYQSSDAPTAVTIGPSDDVYYVAQDTIGCTIYKLSPSLGSRTVAGGGIYTASGVAVDSAGNVYVADQTNSLVRKYNSSGSEVATWSTTGAPSGVAVDPSSNVYVADQTNSLVRKYTSSGSAVTTWSTTGVPRGIAVDSSSNIYITDPANARVRKYTSSGTVVTALNISGAYGVTVDSAGDLYLTGNPTLLSGFWKISAAGVVLMSQSDSSYFGRMRGIAVASDGFVAVADSYRGCVWGYNQPPPTVGQMDTFGEVTTEVSDFEISGQVTLESTTAWLVHPKTPALSVRMAIDGKTESALNIASGGLEDASRDSQAGRQRAAGASEDAIFTVGNRSAPSLTLIGFTLTDSGAASLVSLMSDEAPLMPRFPPSWGMPIEERWYSVGDCSESVIGVGPDRKWSLPLTPAAVPYVIVQPIWSWATVILNYTSWADVIAAFETDYDLIMNNPRS